MKSFSVNPDAPPEITQPMIIHIRICIACRREFDLSTVDPVVNHDKQWGHRDWDEGASTATSFLIPAELKENILKKFRNHPDVIFAEGPLEMSDRVRMNRMNNGIKP